MFHNPASKQGYGPAIQHELENLWRVSTGNPKVCVAVLDGPVDLSHPCLVTADLRVLDTFVPDLAPNDYGFSHGTHVASIIFSQHNSDLRGVAPKCRGLIIPVFTQGNDDTIVPCSQLDLARGIIQAVENGAHIINISGGQLDQSGEPDVFLADAIRLCAEKNVLIVAAVGNDGCSCLHVPAASNGVLAVGAMDDQASPLGFSNWGDAYQTHGILAPGVNIPGANPFGGITHRTGTSFAAPIVAGVASLLLSIQLLYFGELDPGSIATALLQTAHTCDPLIVSDCRRTLSGTLNIHGAYKSILERMSSRNHKPITLYELDRHTNFHEKEHTMTENDALINSTDTGMPNVTGIAPAASVPPSSKAITPSDCGCGCGGAKPVPSDGECKCGGGKAGEKPTQLVYALGELGYDFGIEARRDDFQAGMEGNAYSAADLINYLNTPEHENETADIIWTLNIDATPIYAIRPHGSYSEAAYSRLRQYLAAQVNGGVDGRISIPGVISGRVRLLNGQVVPVIHPSLRGMYCWNTAKLVTAIHGARPDEAKAMATYDERVIGISNFLTRVYYEIRNLGITSQERAMNFAATNAYQATEVFESAAKDNLELDSIDTERSPICRPNSDCWDIKLVFFNPRNRTEQARRIYRFTIDVSDIVPVTVGPVRTWTLF